MNLLRIWAQIQNQSQHGCRTKAVIANHSNESNVGQVLDDSAYITRFVRLIGWPPTHRRAEAVLATSTGTAPWNEMPAQRHHINSQFWIGLSVPGYVLLVLQD